MIIGIVAAVVVAVLIIGVILIASLFKSENNSLAYLKDSSIYYLKDMRKEGAEAIQVCEVKGDYADIWNNVVLTDDGKFLYFYSKANDYGEGTLSRIKVSKLSDDADKNEDNIEKISNDVSQYIILEDGKTVIYCKTNGKVVLYNGKKEEDIAKNVTYFSLTEDEKYLCCYTDEGDDEEGYVIYNLKSGEENELTENISTIYYRGDKKIIYGEYEEDYKVTVYEATYEGEGKEILSDVYTVGSYDEESDSFYYIVARTESGKLYDYIDDPYASQDAGLKEPVWTDYIAVSSLEAEISADDYEYYFVENPRYQSYFYSWELYYDYAKEHYYYVKYVEDEEGYSQRVVSYYDDEADVWYSFDNEKFEADEDAYYDAEDRIELREELKNYEFENEIYDLYLYKKGEEVLVAEDLTDYNFVNDTLVFYMSEENDTTKVSIDDVYSVYDAEYQVKYGSYSYSDDEEDEEDEDTASIVNYAINGNVGTLELEDEIYYVDVAEDGKTLVISLGSNGNECTLDVYTVSGSELKFKETIDDEAMGSQWIDGKYYYYTDVSDDMGTLYVYKNGKSEKLISNAYATGYSNAMFEDGNCMALDDKESNDYVLILKNGEKIKFREVNEYTYIAEDQILYMKDDSLYLYQGKEDFRIARDVIAYYCYDYEYGRSF